MRSSRRGEARRSRICVRVRILLLFLPCLCLSSASPRVPHARGVDAPRAECSVCARTRTLWLCALDVRSCNLLAGPRTPRHSRMARQASQGINCPTRCEYAPVPVALAACLAGHIALILSSASVGSGGRSGAEGH